MRMKSLKKTTIIYKRCPQADQENYNYFNLTLFAEKYMNWKEEKKKKKEKKKIPMFSLKWIKCRPTPQYTVVYRKIVTFFIYFTIET